MGGLSSGEKATVTRAERYGDEIHFAKVSWGSPQLSLQVLFALAEPEPALP